VYYNGVGKVGCKFFLILCTGNPDDMLSNKKKLIVNFHDLVLFSLVASTAIAAMKKVVELPCDKVLSAKDKQLLCKYQ